MDEKSNKAEERSYTIPILGQHSIQQPSMQGQGQQSTQKGEEKIMVNMSNEELERSIKMLSQALAEMDVPDFTSVEEAIAVLKKVREEAKRARLELQYATLLKKTCDEIEKRKKEIDKCKRDAEQIRNEVAQKFPKIVCEVLGE